MKPGGDWLTFLHDTRMETRNLYHWPFVRGIHWWPVDFPWQRASNGNIWCFLWFYLQQTSEQTFKLLVIWDAMVLMWHHCNDDNLIIRLSIMGVMWISCGFNDVTLVMNKDFSGYLISYKHCVLIFCSRGTYGLVTCAFGNFSWWCHDIEALSTLLALCDGNPQATSKLP